MPWKETSVMDERMKFVGRLLSGEKMSPLCKEFGISRVTGHKIWKRYQQDGSRGLYNRSRAPHKHPNQVPFEIEQLIVRLKKEKTKWGAPKIRELVRNKYPTIKLPAISNGSLHFRPSWFGESLQTRTKTSHQSRLSLNPQRA